MLSALMNVQHRPEQAFTMHRWTPVSLRQPSHPSPCVWSLLTRLYKKNQGGKQGKESGPYLPTPAPTVLSLQPLYRQSRQEHPSVAKLLLPLCAEQTGDTKVTWFPMWSKDHAAAESPGELLKMPITRLGYSSGVQHWPNTYEVLSSVPSMGRGEGEHPTPIPEDLSQLMMCLYSAVGKSLHFRPNIKVESALLSPRDLTHRSGHSQTGLQKPCLEGGLRPTCPTAFRAQIKVER